MSTVTVSGLFRDKRSAPDLDNLAKVILDAIQAGSGINDVNFRWRSGSMLFNKSEEPALGIIISEMDEVMEVTG